jgi:hypothetical protein
MCRSRNKDVRNDPATAHVARLRRRKQTLDERVALHLVVPARLRYDSAILVPRERIFCGSADCLWHVACSYKRQQPCPPSFAPSSGSSWSLRRAVSSCCRSWSATPSYEGESRKAAPQAATTLFHPRWSRALLRRSRPARPAPERHRRPQTGGQGRATAGRRHASRGLGDATLWLHAHPDSRRSGGEGRRLWRWSGRSVRAAGWEVSSAWCTLNDRRLLSVGHFGERHPCLVRIQNESRRRLLPAGPRHRLPAPTRIDTHPDNGSPANTASSASWGAGAWATSGSRATRRSISTSR